MKKTNLIHAVTLAVARCRQLADRICRKSCKFAQTCCHTVSPARQIWLIEVEQPITKYYSMEVGLVGEWKKWYNNDIWVNEADFSATLATFVHYTHHITNGELMVTDIQVRATAIAQPGLLRWCISMKQEVIMLIPASAPATPQYMLSQLVTLTRSMYTRDISLAGCLHALKTGGTLHQFLKKA